jgi:hypothetical protein
VLGDRFPDERRLGQIDVGRQVDLGVGELAGQRSLPGDLTVALLGVGRDDRGAGMLRDAVLVGEPGVHQREQLLHRRRDLGVVDALVGPEDDRSRLGSDPELGEVIVEHREAVRAVGVGDVEDRLVGRTDGPGSAEDGGQAQQPHADRGDPMFEAPAPDPAKRRGLSADKPTVRGTRPRRCTHTGIVTTHDPRAHRVSGHSGLAERTMSASCLRRLRRSLGSFTLAS